MKYISTAISAFLALLLWVSYSNARTYRQQIAALEKKNAACVETVQRVGMVNSRLAQLVKEHGLQVPTGVYTNK